MSKKMIFLFLLCLTSLSASSLRAETEKHQFQLGAGLGLAAISDGGGVSFDFDLEPEFFITKHVSVSGRLDLTVGNLDSLLFGARGKYYFSFENHPRFNLFAGMGLGYVANFDGKNFGDFAPVIFGFQYDLTKHIKVGSEISLNIFFAGPGTAVGTRFLPAQLKWAF